MTSMTLPDIAIQTSLQTLSLDWVGMCGIALPVQSGGQRTTALVDVGVSLDAGEARGIHMSRLYLALGTLEHMELNPAALRLLLERFLESHAGLSSCAYIRLKFDQLIKREALVSALSGWKLYPVTLEARLERGMFHVELFVEIPYSSTCPCSAALARQLIQRQFEADFSEPAVQAAQVMKWLGSQQGIVATPHSQRSKARIGVRPSRATEFPLVALIDCAETALGTAVQTAVKRADEQAFALANGQNLMFCEDAARRLHHALARLDWLSGFEVRVEHAESLHAHDAVAISRWQW